MAATDKQTKWLSRTVRENLRDAELSLKGFPELKALGISVLEDGESIAAERLRQVGLAIADILYYGAAAHKEVQAVIERADTIPVPLPACRDIASVYVDHIHDKLGLGNGLGFRTANGKGGPKRFRTESSPSFVALELYYALNEFVIPDSECKARERKRRDLQAQVEFIRRNEPAKIANIGTIRFTAELALLPKLTSDTYLTWADIGARLLVDFPDLLSGYCVGNFPPPIPKAWVARAAKRKGKKGALKDVVRKELEAGFKALAVSCQ